MVKLHLELEGDVGEVVRVLRRIGGARPLDGGAGCRLHVGPGRRGQTGDVPSVAGRCSWHPSEHTLPEDGPVAGGVAHVADEDGPRAVEVSAGAGHGAVAAVAANSPLQSYFVNAEFAAVASDLFGERMPDQLSSGLRRP